MHVTDRGHREIEHTADWVLEVWGPDMETLLQQAAHGMYRLMGVKLAIGDRVEHSLQLDAADREALLVEFLGELLYLMESEGVAFDELEMRVDDGRVAARLTGAAIASQRKEIKAVTFHRLLIEDSGRGLRTRVVFDV